MGHPLEHRVRAFASAHYADGAPVWAADDRWNDAKWRKIDAFCRERFSEISSADDQILNAGAGSHRYDWIPSNAISLDRFAAQLTDMPNPVVADVECLPFRDSSFDVVICIGSVLNYASAMEALLELARVLRPSGHLLLHFESSGSLEHWATKRWQADAAPLPTINNGRPDLIWVYSPQFVWRILGQLNLRVEEWSGFHIASAALLRLGAPQPFASRAQRLDRFLTRLARFADDIVLIARKLPEVRDAACSA